MPGRVIEVQLNLNDGDHYERELVEKGLFVCANCYHACMTSPCKYCHVAGPDEIDLKNQWSEVVLYDCATGKVR